MEYKKITEVNEVAEVTGTEYVYLNQGGKFVQIPLPIFLVALDIQGGADGKDGMSPTVAVSEIEGGHRITITDTNGDHIVDVMDGSSGRPGKDGTDGKDGADGVDGATPNLQIGTVTTLPAGSPATAKITGPVASPVLSLGIPRGADAASGSAGVTSINNLSGDVTLPVPGHCVCNSAASDKSKVLTSFSAGFVASASGAVLSVFFKNPDNSANAPELIIDSQVYTVLTSASNAPPAASALGKSIHHFLMRNDRTAILLDPVIPAAAGITIDTTLTQSGQAADAKAVGTALATRVPIAPLESDAGKVATVGADGIPRWETPPAVGSLFGRCDTAAHDAAKKATYIDGAVVSGTIITVDFAHANEAENPTLTANGATGTIVGRTLESISATSLTSGVHRFVCLSNYNKWLMLDHDAVAVLTDDTLTEAAAYTYAGPGSAQEYSKIIIEIACPSQENAINLGPTSIFGNTIATYFIKICDTYNMKTTITLDILNSKTAIFSRSCIRTSTADSMCPETYVTASDQLIMASNIKLGYPIIVIPAELPIGTRIRITGVKA